MTWERVVLVAIVLLVVLAVWWLPEDGED